MAVALLLLGAVSVVSTAAYPTHSYHIFMDCYDPICSMNGIYGFHCKKGICRYICSEYGCRQDGLVDRPMKDMSNLIFHGCHDLSCAVNGFYGYGCTGGACHYICSSGGCVDVGWIKPTARCSPRSKQLKVRNPKIAKGAPKKVNIKIRQGDSTKEEDLDEQRSTQVSIDATEPVTTVVPVINKIEEKEEVTEQIQLESTLAMELLTEESTELIEASTESKVTDGTTEVHKIVENDIKKSEAIKVLDADKENAVPPSEQDSKRKLATKTPPKKRLLRRLRSSQDQESGEQGNLRRPLVYTLTVLGVEFLRVFGVVLEEDVLSNVHVLEAIFTLKEVCDREAMLNLFTFNPYIPKQGFDAETCNTQCQQMAYTCSVTAGTDFCMCGDRPVDMKNSVYICPGGHTDIRCVSSNNTFLLLHTSLDSALPGLVGGVQEISISYSALQEYLPVPISSMNLEVSVLPESSWEPVGSPPPSTIDFISPTPLTQDVLLGLKYNSRRFAVTPLRISFNRTVQMEKILFECPKQVLKGVSFDCRLIAEVTDGFGGKVTWDQQFSEDFIFPSSNFDYIGTPNLYSGPSLSKCTLDGMVVTGTQAMYAGRVHEVFIKLTAPTTMQIFILRPTCDRGLIYDYFTDTCQPEGFEGTECTDQEVYNPLFRTCVQRFMTESERINKRGIKQDNPKASTSVPYTVVKVTSRLPPFLSLIVDAKYLDLQSFQLQKPFRVEIGDRIGVLPANLEAVDCTHSTKTAPADLVYSSTSPVSIEEGTTFSKLIRLDGKRYKISAAVVAAPDAMLFKGRFETSGVKQVTATVNMDTYSAVPQVGTFLSIINVVGPLQAPQLTQFIFTLGKAEVLCLIVEQGGEATYLWDFGDGSPVETSVVSEVRHIFQRIGLLALSFGVKNAFDSATYTFPIKVYETVSLGALTVEPTNRVFESQKPIDFLATVITGSEISFKWFVDGELIQETATPKASITFDRAANYTVTLNASNCITWQDAQVDIEIVAPIKAIFLESDSIPIGLESYLTFGYCDGLPLSGEVSIDSGAWSPLIIELMSRSLYSPPLLFTDIGRRQATVRLISAQDSVQKNFDFWVEELPNHYLLQAKSRQVYVNDDIVLTSKITGNCTGGTIEVSDDHIFKDVHITRHNEVVPAEITHKHGGYPDPGVYAFHGLLLCAGRAFTNDEIVVVMPSLGTYELRADGERVPQYENYYVHVHRTKGLASPCLSVIVDWGDGSQKSLTFYEEGTPVGHSYTKGGHYDVTAKIKQDKETKNLNHLNVEVGVGIFGFGCFVQPSGVCEVDEEFELIAVYRSNEEVMITLSENGMPATVRQLVREVSNNLFKRQCTLEVETQYRVHDFEAELERSSSRSSGDLALHVRYTGMDLSRPHGVRVSVNWANESSTTVSMPDSVNDLRLTHRMSKDGNLMLEVVVSNNVSSQRLLLPFSYFKPIISVQLNILIDEIDSPGYGPEHECFTTDDSLRFEAVTKGGAINATHLVVKEVDKGVTIFEEIYTSPSIVYKMTAQGEVRLSFIGLADRACVCADLGNGRHLAYPPVGGAKCGECSDYSTASRTLTRKSLILPVVYASPGTFTVTASVSHITAELKVIVSPVGCYAPSILLELPEIANPNTPVGIKVEERLTIIARSNGTLCPQFTPMVYKWQIFKLNYSTTERLKWIDLPQFPSKSNLQVNIPPHLLEPGLYEAYLSGMVDDVEVYSAVSAFIAVAELAPVVRFEKNGEEAVTISESITALCLSPAKYSFNPNIPHAKLGEGLEGWKLTCTRRENGSFSAVTSCELPRIPGMELGDFCIDRGLLNFTNVYHFQARISNGHSVGVGNLQVTFAAGDLPSLQIKMVRPELGLDCCLEGITSVSKTTDLGLEGACTGSCEGAFLWTIKKFDYCGTVIPLTKEELKEASKAEFDNKLLIINSKFLSQWNNKHILLVCFSHTSVLGFKTEVCKRFHPAIPPVLGECRVDHTGEIARDTIVCLSCDGMRSDKRPVLYRFQQGIDGKQFTFATSSEPKYCGRVPYVSGDFDLCVSVTDNMGSLSERCFLSLRFKVETPIDVNAKLEGIFNCTDNELSDSLTSSDPNQISVTVQSLSRLLKDWKKLPLERISCHEHCHLFYFNVDKIAAQLVEATKRLEVTNTNALQMTVSTLSAVAAISGDMTQSAQLQLSFIIQNVIRNFEDISQSSSKEDSIDIGIMILSTFFDVLNGTQSQLISPHLEDVVTKPSTMTYDTDIDNYEPEGDTEEEQYSSLSAINTRMNQELVSAELYQQLVTLQMEVTRSLGSLLTNNEGIAISTPLGKISLRKVSKSSVNYWLSESYGDYSSSSITFAGLEDLFNDTDDILIQTMVARGSLFGFADTAHTLVAAHSMAVELTVFKNEEELSVQGMPGSVTVRIAMDLKDSLPPFTSGTLDGSPMKLPDPIIAVDGSIVHQQLVMVGFEIGEEAVSFSFQIEPDDVDAKPQYLVVASFVNPPDLSNVDCKWALIWALVPPTLDVYDNQSITVEEKEANFTFFINNVDFARHKKEALNATVGQMIGASVLKTLWVGFRQLSIVERNLDWKMLPLPYPFFDQINTTIKYRGFTTTCNFLDKDLAEWSTKGCVVHHFLHWSHS
ncbi:unnamed protein product [Hydatigera taeniaeformis]|uniref:PKD domain-containing protein n=1 Tax=Hydatigena taeniaeformis TaxID=6205 RepID=A0A158RD93_HYDTA|nr:unnamed protein product [Hydatigera taeniaeformis]